MPPEGLWIPQAYQAAEGALTVRGSGIEQHPCHGRLIIAWWAGIEAFSDACRSVATLERELSHQGMRQRVKQHVAQRWVPVVRLQAAQGPPAPMGFEEFVVQVLHRWALEPGLHCIL